MGHEAWQMIGRTPGYIVAVRPLRQGAITDFEITQRMIRLLLHRVGVNRFNRPRVVICVPSAITEVERRAVTEAARRAGAADAQLIEQPMAAAIGAALPIHEPVANMVVDVGGGTSETALISLGGVVALKAVRVGSFDIDAAITAFIRREYGIAVGERTAEEIKMAIGSAAAVRDEVKAEVRGSRSDERAAEDDHPLAGGGAGGDRRAGLGDLRLRRRLPRDEPARAGPGPDPQRREAGGRRRDARRLRPAAGQRDRGAGAPRGRARSSAWSSGPAGASRPTTASRSCSWVRTGSAGDLTSAAVTTPRALLARRGCRAARRASAADVRRAGGAGRGPRRERARAGRAGPRGAARLVRAGGRGRGHPVGQDRWLSRGLPLLLAVGAVRHRRCRPPRSSIATSSSPPPRRPPPSAPPSSASCSPCAAPTRRRCSGSRSWCRPCRRRPASTWRCPPGSSPRSRRSAWPRPAPIATTTTSRPPGRSSRRSSPPTVGGALRHLPPRPRAGHGAVLWRAARHGRDGRPAPRAARAAPRGRARRGAAQLPQPAAGHPVDDPQAGRAARGHPVDRPVPPRAAVA